MPTRLKSRMIATFGSGIRGPPRPWPGRGSGERAEVERDDGADEQPENQQELALLNQVGLARLVDELGDLAHRRMHRHVLQLRVDDQAEEQPERADDQAAEQQRVAVDAAEGDRPTDPAARGWPRRRRAAPAGPPDRPCAPPPAPGRPRSSRPPHPPTHPPPGRRPPSNASISISSVSVSPEVHLAIW